MSFFGMGGMEIMVIMLVALIIFGPGKLPEIGAQVGRAVRDFRRATSDLQREFNDSTSDIRSTMDDMKGTVAQVERESKELAQSIPATFEGAASSATAAANQNGATRSAQTAATQPAASVATSAAPVAAPVAPPAPTRDDPLADLEALDEDVFSERASS